MSRAALDAYYTPDPVALRCTRWLAQRIEAPRSVLEPSVGGGAWVRAAREVWPSVPVTVWDLDPEAPGLREPGVTAIVGDWLRAPVAGVSPGLILGNPPYLEVDRWLAAACVRGDVVALLLRETITGGVRRYRDLWATCRPAWVGKLPARVTWEGGSSHDQVGHVLIVWDGRAPRGETRWDWIVDEARQAGLFGGDRG